MADTLPEHYQIDFSQNWEFLLQQNDCRLANFITPYTVAGKERKIDQLGTVEMQAIASRLGAASPQDLDTAHRWIKPKGYDIETRIDEFDDSMLGELSAPSNQHVQAHARAYNRKKDDIIISALEGTSYTGENGTTATALPAAQKVAVNLGGSNEGLTLQKMIRAKKILDDNEVPEEGRCMAVASKQLNDDLLNSVDKVSSADYANVKALVEGQIDYFLGFHFVRLERLTLNTSTDVRSVLAWQKDGIGWGENYSRKVHLDILPDKKHALQIRSVVSMDATRIQEEYVVEIACDESP